MSKVIIAGAGISGLSAGIFLLKGGHEVHIYEKNSSPCEEIINEGLKDSKERAYIRSFKGMHKSSSVYPLWEETGAIDAKTKFIRLSRFQTVDLGDERLILWRDLERTRKELLLLSPEDEIEINKLIDAVKMLNIEKINVKKPIDMMNQFELMATGIAGGNANKALLAYTNIDINDLSACFKHPLISLAIKSVFPGDNKAYEFISEYANFCRGNRELPLGGFGKTIKNIEEKFLNLGGNLHTGAEVKKFVAESKRISKVILASGEEVSGDYFIGAVDAHHLFYDLLDEKYMNRDMKKAFENDKLFKIESEFGALYKIKGKCEDLASNGCIGLRGITVGADLRSRVYYRCFDYDESLSEENESYLWVYFEQDLEDYLYWKSIGVDEESLELSAKSVAENVKNIFEDKYPQIKGKTEIVKVMTPYHYAVKYNHYMGSHKGFTVTKKVDNYSSSNKVKKLKNLFLAGIWQEASTGIDRAVIAGKFAAERVKRG